MTHKLYAAHPHAIDVARIAPAAATAALQPAPFFGWRVVAGAFVLAAFGWGLGFYGMPAYLQAVHQARGWPVLEVSTAVTVHYLCGAAVIANIPTLYRRFGLPWVTRVGVVAMALGLTGWATATAPWQLYLATLLSGGGWATMGAAAINAIVSPWFVRQRPQALSAAYNGSSVGGAILSPLWVYLIARFGFPTAAMVIGGVAICVVWALSFTVFDHSPARMGQFPDGDFAASHPESHGHNSAAGPALWKDRTFRTLACGMALGLFAQIGLLTHILSLIVPTLGTGLAGSVMGLTALAAIFGRMPFVRLIRNGSNRRLAAALSYGLQIIACGVLILSYGQIPALIILGVLLFGLGVGNATSLPPLIAQAEFSPADVMRVVALIVAISQATYAFAPAVFGIIRDLGAQFSIPGLIVICIATIAVDLVAIAAFLNGRRRRSSPA